MRPALGRLIRRLLAAGVTNVRTAVVNGIRIQDLAVVAGLRNAEAIAFANDRRRIDHHNDQSFLIFPPANETQDAIVGVICVNPFETVPVEIDLIKRGFGNVKLVEIDDEPLNTPVLIPLQ